jgi:hypothetical protein
MQCINYRMFCFLCVLWWNSACVRTNSLLNAGRGLWCERPGNKVSEVSMRMNVRSSLCVALTIMRSLWNDGHRLLV